MPPMKNRFLAFAAFLVAGSLYAAEKPSSPVQTSAASESMPGLKVGEKAADFTLKNFSGEDVSLQSLLKDGKVALAFVRSADWCPFCRKQLQDLQANLNAIK